MTAQPIADLGIRIREHLARRDRAKRAAWFMPGQAAQANARFVTAMVEAAQIYANAFAAMSVKNLHAALSHANCRISGLEREIADQAQLIDSLRAS
jgi:hypothetical protein